MTPISNTEDLNTNITHICEDVSCMGLYSDLARTLCICAFNQLTSVQQQTIIPIAQHKDVIIQSKTGTGKTVAFMAGGLNKIIPSLRATQMVIIQDGNAMVD